MQPLGQLDPLMAAAWPAANVEDRDGWLLRWTHGVSRRANSVLAVGDPGNLGQAIDDAEAFYRHRGARPIFQISEASAPALLVDLLGSRGYEQSATTWMLWTTAADVPNGSPTAGIWHLETSSEPSAEWFDAYWSVESDRHNSDFEADVVRNVLLRTVSPALFVSARRRDDDRVAAVGQAVLSDGWACVQCLATPKWARRQGAARAVVNRLAEDSARTGTSKMFAAVMAENAASLTLFDDASFRRSHTYSYLTAPEPGLPTNRGS